MKAIFLIVSFIIQFFSVEQTFASGHVLVQRFSLQGTLNGFGYGEHRIEGIALDNESDVVLTGPNAKRPKKAQLVFRHYPFTAITMNSRLDTMAALLDSRGFLTGREFLYHYQC